MYARCWIMSNSGCSSIRPSLDSASYVRSTSSITTPWPPNMAGITVYIAPRTVPYRPVVYSNGAAGAAVTPTYWYAGACTLPPSTDFAKHLEELHLADPHPPLPYPDSACSFVRDQGVMPCVGLLLRLSVENTPPSQEQTVLARRNQANTDYDYCTLRP